MLPVSEFRELNGLRHHLLRWDGPADAPTLVLLHGFLDLSWSFQPFAEQLTQLVPLRIVGLDLRGHGRTEWVGRGGYYHFADYIADVHALLQTMSEPVFLLGHSMGGSVSSLVAGSFPSHIRKLVLVEGGIGPAGDPGEPPDRMVDWISQVQERRRRPPRPMASRAEAEARLRQSNPRMTSAMAKLLAEQGTTGVEGGFVWSFDPLHRTRSPVPYSMEQYRTFLARIACPTLFVAGLESDLLKMVDDADYRQRLASVRNLRLVEVPKAGHMIHQDQPRALAEEVAKFLTQG